MENDSNMSRNDVRKKLHDLKMEAASELGMTQYVRENNDHYKGDLASRVNGLQGGPIGGRMVKKMIQDIENKM